MNSVELSKSYTNFEYRKRFFCFFVFLTSSVTYLITNTMLPNAIDPKIFLDDFIPLIPWTVIIYHMWYPGILLLIYRLRYNNDFDDFIKCLAIGMTCCVFFYKIIPFYVSVRPNNLGDSIFEKILNLTYLMDQPTSSMPSSHVVLSCIAYNYAYKHKFTSIMILNFLIPYVTLTTKQHVIADVFAGIVFASLVLFFFCKSSDGKLSNKI